MNFADRPPSSHWQLQALADEPQRHFWAWFKPSGIPEGLCLQIPEESRSAPDRPPLTMRALLRSVGMAPLEVSSWSRYGTAIEAGDDAHPCWDEPIPAPESNADPTIVLIIQSESPESVATVEAGSASTTSEIVYGEVFARMDLEWRTILQLEAQIEALRQQLLASQMRITALNRDLSGEESRGADQKELRQWRECRNWMRGVVTCFTRCLKEHQIVMTAAAARRPWLEATYAEFVFPQRHFEGADHTAREFESYRQSLQQLMVLMNVVRDPELLRSEQRVYHIQNRIAARMRLSRPRA